MTRTRTRSRSSSPPIEPTSSRLLSRRCLAVSRIRPSFFVGSQRSARNLPRASRLLRSRVGLNSWMQVLGRMFPVERRAAKAYKAPVRNWLRNLVAASIGLAIGLVLIEVSLIWIVPPPLHYRYPQTLHVVDHELGWVMRPNQHAFTIAWPVVTNGLGLRSPEIAAVKRPGTIRVLCLGDSNTFGIGVAQEETYAARLQALLRGQGRAEAEVINAGGGGYD